jgi:hypothetical protein
VTFSGSRWKISSSSVDFDQLRQRMMASAQAQGIFTDEGVFNRVS